MLKNTISLIVLLGCICFLSGHALAQKKNKQIPRVCGNPEAACKGRSSYQPYELPVQWPANSVIAESEAFYGIILKSAKSDFSSEDCNKVYSNEEVQSYQYKFPTNKVFALKCADAGYNYYTGVDGQYVFIAVYAGRSLGEANKFLKFVQAETGLSGLKVRKMTVGMNGT